MAPMQEQLHDVLMGLVAPGNEEAAEAIVAPGLARLAAGEMSADDIDQAVEQMMPLVDPEKVGELQQIAADVKAQLG